MKTFIDEITFVIETCIACGTSFGMAKNLHDTFRRTHKEFYCPNGHRQYYGESTEERALKQAQENGKWWKERAEEKAKQLSATKGMLTRTRNRIANGICPCCHRSFASLARHMQNQHPDYKEESENSL